MDDWTRVLLYGTFEGFSRSTDGDDNILLVLDNGDKAEIPNHFVKNASDFVEKNKIKLKDVIARIEKFDLATKAVWINEILNKLGSDYGLYKYYAGYKQGKFDGAMERKKVTVPQFVADWIEEAKKEYYSILGAINKAPKGEVEGWIELQNVETFAEAWVNGYEVKKEKQYEVILCNGQSLKTVYRQGNDRLDFEKVYGDLERFTRTQLEAAGFGWIFDCPGMEVREVE